MLKFNGPNRISCDPASHINIKKTEMTINNIRYTFHCGYFHFHHPTIWCEVEETVAAHINTTPIIRLGLNLFLHAPRTQTHTHNLNNINSNAKNHNCAAKNIEYNIGV